MFKKAVYVPSGRRPPLALTKSGYITFSQSLFFGASGSHGDLAVNLYWDESEGSMAIVLTRRKASGSFPVIPLPNKKTVRVPAQQFFKANKLDPLRYANFYDVKTVRADRIGLEGVSGQAFVVALKPVE